MESWTPALALIVIGISTMKNTILILFSVLISCTGLFAQHDPEFTPSGFSSVHDASAMADQIVKAAGMKRNFLIAEADVPNAVAVFHKGKRYIMYNPKFVDLLTRATGTKWAGISILAHEIGHHLYPNSVNKGKIALATELEADEFSGFVLEKMGATLAEAQAAMSVLASGRASSTHPARVDRIQSIAKGWKNAGGVEQAIEEETVVPYTKNSIVPGSMIAATINFTASRDAEYFVTTRMNVIKIANDQVNLIGRFAKTTSADFPYMIYDDTGYRIYVDTRGKIFTGRGKEIGNVELKE